MFKPIEVAPNGDLVSVSPQQSMGRRQLRSFRSERHSFNGHAEDHPLQNGSFPQAIPLDAELAEVLLNWKLRCAYSQPTVGVCQSTQEGQTAVLAGVVVSGAFETGTRKRRGFPARLTGTRCDTRSTP
jgi:hypothetical protein